MTEASTQVYTYCHSQYDKPVGAAVIRTQTLSHLRTNRHSTVPQIAGSKIAILPLNSSKSIRYQYQASLRLLSFTWSLFAQGFCWLFKSDWRVRELSCLLLGAAAKCQHGCLSWKADLWIIQIQWRLLNFALSICAADIIPRSLLPVLLTTYLMRGTISMG